MKRGQISIFILVAIIILILTTIIFFTNQSNIKNSRGDLSGIREYIKDCLEESLVKSLRDTGLKKEIFKNDSEYRNLTLLNIKYYYYKGKDRFPSLNKIEEDLEIKIKPYFNKCINNFEIFREKGFEVTSSIEEFKVDIVNHEVEVSLISDINIIKGKAVTEFESIKTNIDFNFIKIYNVLSNFIEEQKKNPNFIPLGYIGMISLEEDILIQTANLPDDNILYYFQFNNIKLNEDPYQFYFLIKYDWSDFKDIEDVKNL